MEDRRIRKFGYEDTDKKLEIDLYGIVFEIKNIESIEKIEGINRTDKDVVEKYLKNILGEDCIERINKKRKEDGYNKLDLNIELNILGCIFEVYGENMVNGVLGRINNTVNNAGKQMDKYTNNFNREQRRNHNKKTRGYRSRGY